MQSTMFAMRRSVPMSLTMHRALEQKRRSSAPLGPTRSQICHKRAHVLPTASKNSRCKLTNGISLLEKKGVGRFDPTARNW